MLRPITPPPVPLHFLARSDPQTNAGTTASVVPSNRTTTDGCTITMGDIHQVDHFFYALAAKMPTLPKYQVRSR